MPQAVDNLKEALAGGRRHGCVGRGRDGGNEEGGVMLRDGRLEGDTATRQAESAWVVNFNHVRI